LTTENLLQKDRKEKWKMPTHKTAHLQTAQADTRPKFAKELFSCRCSCQLITLWKNNRETILKIN